MPPAVDFNVPRATAAPRPAAPALLDLAAIEEEQRAAIWSRTARSFFPGLTVRGLRVNPKMGTMRGIPFGPGQLWTILSPPLCVEYSPVETDDPRGPHNFSLMMQLEGSTAVSQAGNTCQLRRQEFCLIDQRWPFQLDVVGPFSHFMFLQMPRDVVMSRHPYLRDRVAEAFDPNEPGAALLRTVLLGLLETAPFLGEDQRAAALGTIAQTLGVPKPPGDPLLDDVNRRARSALAVIDAELSDPTLTASRVAERQGISRRHLDEILLRTIGQSINARIWTRRLEQAASDLIDPRYASRTVTQIAFALGFEDSAHFTRAFKRRYHCTPREWRRRGQSCATDVAEERVQLKA